jgi:hypothetical protein
MNRRASRSKWDNQWDKLSGKIQGQILAKRYRRKDLGCIGPESPEPEVRGSNPLRRAILISASSGLGGIVQEHHSAEMTFH